MGFLTNENVLLVGGFGPLGAALIPKLQAEGAHVIVGDIKATFGVSLQGPFARVQPVFLDATKPESVVEVSEKLMDCGRPLSHVVNFVGGCRESLTSMFETTSGQIRETINLNLLSQIFVVHELGEHLMQTPAANKSFTLISSVNAHAGWSIPYYSAAKAALMGLVRPAAIELGGGGVRINAVTLGSLRTPSTEKQGKDFTARAEAAALRRLTTADEAAEAILSTMRMTGMTGQEIVLDCGQSVNPSESLYDQHRHRAGAIVTPNRALG